MSIPVWTYDEKHYENLTRGEPFEIRTDPIKGKGLFAKQEFARGDIALVETAMCCTQNLDECVRNVPCCAHCLVSLESARGLVSRATHDKTFAAELPYVKAFNTRRRHIIYCKHVDAGCALMFCSYRCREAAWSSFHFAGCRGCMSEEGKKQYDEFTTAAWQQAGIDYSDTHFLAFRFMCSAVTRHRLHGMGLDAAYAQIGQLIRAPLHKFSFSFLLTEVESELPKDLSAEEKRNAKWQRFLKYKDLPATEDPAVAAAEAEGGVTKNAMLRTGLDMLTAIFAFNDEEKAFFTIDRWSELLGAVLLNGQERTPNSPYIEYCEFVTEIDGGKSLRAYEKRAKEKGYDLSKCATSTRGQGIYPVGCLFNHSCRPNLQVQYTSENDESLVAICLCDIKAGEELCISYIDESMHYFERQQQLFEHYLFNCRCAKCVADAAALEEKPTKEPVKTSDSATSSPAQ